MNMADPDRDGLKSSEENKQGTNPLDPSNSTDTIKSETFSFVRDLTKYNDSQKDNRALPVIYPNLAKAIYVVEKQPKIIQGLDKYGSDSLVLFMEDKDQQEILDYLERITYLVANKLEKSQPRNKGNYSSYPTKN